MPPRGRSLHPAGGGGAASVDPAGFNQQPAQSSHHEPPAQQQHPPQQQHHQAPAHLQAQPLQQQQQQHQQQHQPPQQQQAAASQDPSLVPTSALGPHQRVFSYPSFNRVQSACFERTYRSDDSLLVSAPTGSGKTGIFELAICRLLAEAALHGGQLESFSVLYFGPIKALTSEMRENFSDKFGPFGVTVGELTGDVDDMRAATRHPIVCCTPEKWDSFSRSWENSGCEATKLVLIDEVHMLNEERGATLEACVARLRMRMPATRIIACSATISNPLDLSEWLGVSSPMIFGAEFRPVPLRTIVQPYPKGSTSEFLFDKRLTHHLSSTIQQYSDGRPTLVFCATRAGAADAAKSLANESQQLLQRQPGLTERLERLRQASQTVQDAQLAECLRKAVGYHSAGLLNSDRKTVERLFKASDLLVVCTTTTLSQGVNLPAHLVIVKSTLQWKGAGNGYQEYSPNMLRQMVGRAGRPQFDTHGTAVIMTAQENAQQYRALADSQEVIESQIGPRLCDAINSEIAGGLIHDVGDLMSWIHHLCKYTRNHHHSPISGDVSDKLLVFTDLSVRFRKNPGFYDRDGSLRRAGNGDLDAMLQELCMMHVRELAEHKMIETADGFSMAPTQTGHLISRHYIRFDTMKTLSELTQTATTSDILNKMSYAAEFESASVKHNEKSLLKKLNDKVSRMHSTMTRCSFAKICCDRPSLRTRCSSSAPTALEDGKTRTRSSTAWRKDFSHPTWSSTPPCHSTCR